MNVKDKLLTLNLLIIATLGIALIPISASATTPDQFPSVKAMITHFGDFKTQDGTFKIIKEKPLHIILNVEANIYSEPDMIENDIKKAIVYGMYRTFIHTNEQQITVTSTAIPMKNPGQKPSAKEIKYLSQFKKTATLDRKKALDLIRRFGVANEFSELVEDWTFNGVIHHNQWSKASEKIRYSHSGLPGVSTFYGEIIKP